MNMRAAAVLGVAIALLLVGAVTALIVGPNKGVPSAIPTPDELSPTPSEVSASPFGSPSPNSTFTFPSGSPSIGASGQAVASPSPTSATPAASPSPSPTTTTEASGTGTAVTGPPFDSGMLGIIFLIAGVGGLVGLRRKSPAER